MPSSRGGGGGWLAGLTDLVVEGDEAELVLCPQLLHHEPQRVLDEREVCLHATTGGREGEGEAERESHVGITGTLIPDSTIQFLEMHFLVHVHSHTLKQQLCFSMMECVAFILNFGVYS